MNDIEARFKAIQEVEPDIDDLQAIERIKKRNDTSEGITLAQMDKVRDEQEFSGKISLRLPKSLHRILVQGAKEEGVSLNQFILYKLAK
ncbi:MAG: type II toxin-antitoxin system HicB family antitoxin [Clostridiales bacterium]|jgi:predicted HicB family RNase H-like nuclease|nr:type II toxin-antitoxin system HicB family antitoxin [Clostridiales bacterium]MDR2711523.1 type II toxin-antitoxin system HicB family antitoxin [Clostridiales bacterium]